MPDGIFPSGSISPWVADQVHTGRGVRTCSTLDATAEISWAATKALVDSFIILAVLLIFGAAPSWLALLTFVPLLFGSLFTAAATLVVTAHVRDIDSYNLYIAIFFSLVDLAIRTGLTGLLSVLSG